MTPGTLRVAARLLTTGLLVAGLTALPAPAPAVPGSTIFTQSTPLYVGDDEDIRENQDTVTFGAGGGTADIYPTEIVLPHFARILDVDVEIQSFTHQNPDDVQFVLARDGGPQVTLMANAGGSNSVSGVYLGFDDEETVELPDNGALATMDYKPTIHGTPTHLPQTDAAMIGNTSLAVFDGLAVSGTWQLFALDDDGSAFTGSFDGFQLIITSATNPYPAGLVVSGAGAVTDIDVLLHGLTGTHPDETDLLLVGPTGRQATLMSDVGGTNTLVVADLRLDDEAAGLLPDNGPLTTGTYKPTNVQELEPDVYPDPAPTPSGATELTAFDGTDPNGTWRLFAVDDEAGDVTMLAGGWSLDIDWDDSASPTGSVSIAGAAATKTSSVTLNLAASDPAPATGVKEMRFSNDGTTYSPFVPYAATAPWTLSKGDGTKTVFAQFRDAAGNVSAASSDTVVLDTTNPGAKKLRPRKNATDVKPKAKVRVVATEALDPATVTKRSVVLKHDGAKVKAKVTYLAARHTIVLKPNKLLEPGDYKVTVKTRITDLVGNRFDAKKKKGLQRLTWTFTVG